MRGEKSAQSCTDSQQGIGTFGEVLHTMLLNAQCPSFNLPAISNPPAQDNFPGRAADGQITAETDGGCYAANNS